MTRRTHGIDDRFLFANAVSAVFYIVRIEYDPIFSLFVDAEQIIIGIRSRKADDYYNLVSAFVPTDKRYDISICIIGCKPFETIPGIVYLI